MKLMLSTLAAVALAASASAQQIIVNIGGSWTGTPACQQVINTFTTSNGAGGFITGGATAEVGTSFGGCYTRATATVQGYIQSGSSVTDGRQSVAGTIEFYTNAGGGNVAVTLNAQPEAPLNLLRGTGYSGLAGAAVAVTCPYFGWLRASCITQAIAPPAFPSILTLPVSASASATGQTSFNINMSAGSRAFGTLLNVGDGFQMFAGANATGTVTLN